ncbi:MAG: hypothetical protein JW715_13730 [Sedimentisphaerales bacterium]|nr:hypothetical protein [Sedimentisphaerales bacterium]
MKRLLPILLFSFSVILPHGCRTNNSVEVTVEGDGQFPPSLAGRWKADFGFWEIVLEPDGKISSAKFNIGEVAIKPGRTTIVPMLMGGKGTFKPGLWTVHYIPDQRQLIVELAIDSFHIEMGENTVKGRTRDFFVGNVSEGGTTWWTQRFSYPEYIVDTKKYPDYTLPEDPNENPKENILFQKVPEQQ